MFPLNAVAAAAGGRQEYTTLAGSGFGRIGFYDQDPGGQLGSISPNNTYQDIYSIFGIYTLSVGTQTWFELMPPGIVNDDAVFFDLAISGVFNTGQSTNIYRRSDAVYVPATDGNNRVAWHWSEVSNQQIMVAGNNYDIVIRFL